MTTRKQAPLIKRFLGKKKLVAYITGLNHPTDPDGSGVGFEFEDVSVIFYEDPDDGYRSSCEAPLVTEGSLSALTHYKTPVTRMSADVIVSHVSTHNREVFEMRDAHNKQIVAVVGTEATNDYYPYYTAEWHPQNFSVPIRSIT